MVAALVALLLDSGRLADPIAEVVQLGSANVTSAGNGERLDDRGVEREDTFNANAEADLADGERRTCA